MKKGLRTLIIYVVLFAAVIGVIAFVSGTNESDKLKYSDIVEYFEKGQVYSFEVSNSNILTLDLYSLNEDGTVNYDTSKVTKDAKSYELYSISLFHSDIYERFVVPQHESGIIVEYEYEPISQMPLWVSILPYAILIIFMIVFWIFFIGRANKPGGKINSFGKARVKIPSHDKGRVLFTDVAGADEEKAELQEIVEFLKNPDKFTKLGAKIPHGVLLVGPPGTGKTLLAKAVAGEAGVPFFSISGSDFVEMYVGLGASRVRDLFDTARKSPASIIFIDEIDAVGRHRGAGLGGGHDEREQTLNQLLVEMDGFGSHDGIIVIAATNRPDILDPALLRPGRFDRQITVNPPDLNGRIDILKVHSKNKPFESDVDLTRIASQTVGFTGADLANLLNEAALLAASRGKKLIGSQDIEDAFLKIVAGPQKKKRVMNERDLKNTAYHEAGHAIVAQVLPLVDPVQLISIIPSGRALGYTLNPPVEDRYSVYKEEIKQDIAVFMGGRVAEELIFGDFSGGASNDIERATQKARYMVKVLGMSEKLGPINYGSSNDEVFVGRSIGHSENYSEKISAQIDEEVHNIVTEAYNRARQILTENLDKLHFIASYLLSHETMDGDQLNAVMEGGATVEALEAIAEEKKEKSKKANEQRAREEAEKRRIEALEENDQKNKKDDKDDEEANRYSDNALPF